MNEILLFWLNDHWSRLLSFDCKNWYWIRSNGPHVIKYSDDSTLTQIILCNPHPRARRLTKSWWRHQMEIFSALLVICAGNLTVTGEFPAQRSVTLSFDVIFDLLWTNGWANNRDAGDLRRHRAHYKVILIYVRRRSRSWVIKKHTGGKTTLSISAVSLSLWVNTITNSTRHGFMKFDYWIH